MKKYIPPGKIELPPVYSEKLGFGRGFGTDGEYVVREDGMKVRRLQPEEKRILLGLAGIIEEKDQAVKELQRAEKAYQEYLNKTVGEVSDV